MLHIQKWKIILTLLLTLLGVAYAAPNLLSEQTRGTIAANMPGWFPQKVINLGLDLQGGSHLLLRVDTKAVMADRFEAMADAARAELRKENIGYTDLAVTREGIALTLRNVAGEKDAAYKILRALEAGAVVDIEDDGRSTVVLSEQGLRDIQTQVINQSIEIVRRRVDESGTREPVIQRQGIDRIVVQLPGIDDPARIKELLGRTAKMSFHLLDDSLRAGPLSRSLPLKDNGGGAGGSVTIKKKVMVSGDMLVDSQPGFDRNMPIVSFRFNSIGAKKFCDVTRDNVGKPFAIVLDEEVISAPVIQTEICGGSGQITGDFTVKEATDLALLLRAGALPAPLEVVEERSVGPSLGSDSVASGKTASLVAFGMVILFMFATYGLFGMFANTALIFNVVFIFAIMSLLGATLTLPGIAGIVLTIGMAVDANVLIYERIRDELRMGRSILSSVDTGYKLAMNTIIDSNRTTLIVALILFSFGTGPVKGFAVSMSIGIVTSMFSAIMLTRLMVIAWLRHKKPTTLNL